MRITLFMSLIMSTVTSLACIPDGTQLHTREKVVFEEALSKSNLSCAIRIRTEIGDISAANINVYEDADDAAIEYTVVGPNKRVKIVRVNYNGQARFYCEEITGLPRGC